MMNFFRRHMRVIFIVTIVAFLGGSFFGAGAYFFKRSTDYAAKVNGAKIPMGLFYSIYTNSVRNYQQATNKTLGEKEFNEIKVRVIQALVQTELLFQQSNLYNINITDEELKADLQNSLEFRDGDIFSVQKYMAFLNAIQMKPKDYESLRRKQIAASKLKMTIASSVKLCSHELDAAAKQKPPLNKNDLLIAKINLVLNEWYINLVKNSKIISNDLIFKVS